MIESNTEPLFELRKKAMESFQQLRKTYSFFLGINITRPNCALDRRTVLYRPVPRFQRQVLKYFPKYK